MTLYAARALRVTLVGAVGGSCMVNLMNVARLGYLPKWPLASALVFVLAFAWSAWKVHKLAARGSEPGE